MLCVRGQQGRSSVSPLPGAAAGGSPCGLMCRILSTEGCWKIQEEGVSRSGSSLWADSRPAGPRKPASRVPSAALSGSVGSGAEPGQRGHCSPGCAAPGCSPPGRGDGVTGAPFRPSGGPSTPGLSVVFKGLQMICFAGSVMFFCLKSWILIFSAGPLHSLLKHSSHHFGPVEFAAPVFKQPGRGISNKWSGPFWTSFKEVVERLMPSRLVCLGQMLIPLWSHCWQRQVPITPLFLNSIK